MDTTVLQCIQTRTDFFEKYYAVPNEVQAEVNAFIGEMQALGERSDNAQIFEAAFAANGLQERFNALLMRCTPKPYSMTQEEKAAARQTAQEIFREDRSRIIKEAVADTVDDIAVMANEEHIAQRRRAMIDAGVYDEYTRASNMVENVGGLLKGLFKKK